LDINIQNHTFNCTSFGILDILVVRRSNVGFVSNPEAKVIEVLLPAKQIRRRRDGGGAAARRLLKFYCQQSESSGGVAARKLLKFYCQQSESGGGVATRRLLKFHLNIC